MGGARCVGAPSYGRRALESHASVSTTSYPRLRSYSPMGSTENLAHLDSLSISDTDGDNTNDLFASPPKHNQPLAEGTNDEDEPPDVSDANARSLDFDEDASGIYEDTLRRELASLKSMNSVISGITTSLEKAKDNMDSVSATVNNASALLATWTRILSQTEHNQRLILNPSWHGASKDLTDAENEEVQQRHEQEQREAEEGRKARQREAEREEAERRRALEGTKSIRGRGGKTVGKGGTTARGGGYVGVGGQGGQGGTGRGSSIGRIGRGYGGSRGRGKG